MAGMRGSMRGGAGAGAGAARERSARRTRLRALPALLVAAVLWVLPLPAMVDAARAQASETPSPGGVPYVPTPWPVVKAMLELAKVGEKDFVIDLGSGDGRVVIEAARSRGARGLGVELDPDLVQVSNDEARRLGVASRALFERRDLFETDLSPATVVTLYLLPPIVQGLRPVLLRQLRPGSRIVSHDFPFEGWQADASETFFAPEKNDGRGGNSTVFLYVVPAEVHGRWAVSWSGAPADSLPSVPAELRLQQVHQVLDAELSLGRQVLEVRDARLAGERVRFTVALPVRAGGPPAAPWQFEGRVEGETMGGIARNDRGVETRWQARRTAVR